MEMEQHVLQIGYRKAHEFHEIGTNHIYNNKFNSILIISVIYVHQFIKMNGKSIVRYKKRYSKYLYASISSQCEDQASPAQQQWLYTLCHSDIKEEAIKDMHCFL